MYKNTKPTMIKARRMMGLTLEGLAARTELHYQTVWQIENGKVEPKQETRERIETVLNTPIDWLATRFEKLLIT